MKITTRGRYAIRMLTLLAERGRDEYVSLTEISEALGVSKKYLEQIVRLLAKADIVLANRGIQGGYKLADAPEHITAGKVLRLTEDDFFPAECFGKDGKRCPDPNCSALPVWQGLSEVVYRYLDGVTLADLAFPKR